MNKDNGLLVVLSSPSGGGKTTVIHKIIERSNGEYFYSISMTTRPKREGEVNGKDYWFVSEDEFLELIARDGFIEYESVHDWYYGTPKGAIENWLCQGKIVFLDLDVIGALNLKKQYSGKTLLIFLKPPSEKVLLDRLKKRSTETSQQIAKRLERVTEEMNRAPEFDVVLVNENLEKTIQSVIEIIKEKRKIC